MKKLTLAACAFLLMFIYSCKKHSGSSNLCSMCSIVPYPLEHFPDTNGVSYYLPTAFTPNGDGINDLYRFESTGLIADSLQATIWDANGNEVFNGSLATGWDGRSPSGAKCAAGKYCVKFGLSYKLSSGVIFSANYCGVAVTLLQYTGNCIKTNGVSYYFSDQWNPLTGAPLTTNEKLCP